MPSRRWLQFSLRSVLAVLTIACVWLGPRAEEAREQREAVKAIRDLGGTIKYDWQPEATELMRVGVLQLLHPEIATGTAAFVGDLTLFREKPAAPAWLRRIIGDEFFQKVEYVAFRCHADFTDSEIRNWRRRLQQLRQPRTVVVMGAGSDRVASALKAEFPRCEIISLPERYAPPSSR